MGVSAVLRITSFFTFHIVCSLARHNEYDRELVNELFVHRKYNPLIRPVINLTTNVNVDFGMAMIQLINVDERNQVMKSNVWLRMTWLDYQLEWDPKDHGGIDTIRLRPYTVWKPDIVLFNIADGKYEVSYKPNVVIGCNGTVLWVPPAIYKSSCTIDVQYFPFDEQTCKLTFGSWTFNANQVTLGWYSGDYVDLSDYVNSGTWDIIQCDGKIVERIDVDGMKQVNIEFEIKIRRKTLFFAVNLIIPCLLISFLSACVFALPADAGEKMTMCISVLLALVVFMLIVTKLLPPTSITIPLIAKYLLFTFIMDIISVIVTVFVLNWNFRTPRTHRMPKLVRCIFLNYLPKILLMKRPSNDQEAQKSNMKNQARQLLTMTQARTGNIHTHHIKHNNVVHHPRCMAKMTSQESNNSNNSNVDFSVDSNKGIEAVRFIAAHLKNEDDYAEILEDWKYVAMVIDRLQLYLFFAITVCGTVGILINAPHLFEYVDQDAIKRKYSG